LNRPFVDDLAGGQIGIPCQAAEAVEVGLGEVVAQPRFVEATLATPMKPWTSLFTGAGPRLESRVSFHWGTRKTIWRDWPIYSCAT
jgi:hypothetical protein